MLAVALAVTVIGNAALVSCEVVGETALSRIGIFDTVSVAAMIAGAVLAPVLVALTSLRASLLILGAAAIPFSHGRSKRPGDRVPRLGRTRERSGPPRYPNQAEVRVCRQPVDGEPLPPARHDHRQGVLTTHNGENWECSGSTVNSNGKDSVITAGPCVYGSLGGEVPGEG